MKLYTKTGDGGESSLYGGARLPKDDLRFEAYGTIDELNASLGLVLSHDEAGDFRFEITALQSTLFVVGSELASPEGKTPTGLELVSDKDTEALERRMDELEQSLEPLANFILPGGSHLSASLHAARTVARRAERAVVHLSHAQVIRPELIRYLNRLSDYLFMLARYVNKQSGVVETPWKPRV